ncbi:hypothetical protein [Marinibactrum halimedae]|uniref:Uncharacterized protein n=1 Tax=Marinibactrum halimedae TaxID=1444977 RepID=A0AA37T332_9GAMM|nr:hypothetical protein [Marinibactrum halimedae]MCD9459906.1 hypothetical protein [Marinibactrum halimedae]GLS25239.1 hypothetical protein GCM10007877_09530 [Marinibactrum halimedae]
MTIETWSPNENTEPSETLNVEQLKSLSKLGHEEKLNNLTTLLSHDERNALRNTMLLSFDQWKQSAASLSESEIWNLMRFLTVAENQFSECKVGSQSPVIALNQLLKSQGIKLGKERLQWIKQHSDNKFIPNGPL